MKRGVVTALLVVVAVVAVPVAAVAAWVSPGLGHGAAGATYVVKAATPTVTRSGTTAVISWPQGMLNGGVVATGYVVKRTSGATTTTICTVAEPAHTCTDNAPVVGSSSYQVFSLYRSWTGAGSDAATFTFDLVAPVTTLSSNPVPNVNGYTLTAPTITLTATDAETSVASITYQVGSGSPVTVNQSSVSFSVSSLGNTVVTYSATDAAGNNESTHTYIVRRDGTAPTTTVSASPAPNGNGYFTSAPTLTFTATDAETSVASVTYRVGAGALVTTPGSTASVLVPDIGTTVVTYYATDAAGNVETAKTYMVSRDTTAPTTVTVKDPTAKDYKVGNNGAQSWARTCGTRSGICGTAIDTGSGISSMTYRLIKGTTCYDGSAFVSTIGSGTACDVAMTYDSTNLDWFGGILRASLPVGSYSVTVTATNGAGATATSAPVAFTTS